MAGLWERWMADDNVALESCTIIVTDANDLVRNIHDRMPVILAREEYEEWLGPDNTDLERLTIMGRGEPPQRMKGRLAPDRSLTPTLSHKGRGRNWSAFGACFHRKCDLEANRSRPMDNASRLTAGEQSPQRWTAVTGDRRNSGGLICQGRRRSSWCR